MTTLLAQFNEESAAVIAAVLFFGIPIIAILTHHQRKMAELIHKNHQPEVLPAVVDEVNRLRTELQGMRTELNSTRIELDDLRNQRQTAQRYVEERVSEQ
jgi:hypothetical protein